FFYFIFNLMKQCLSSVNCHFAVHDDVGGQCVHAAGNRPCMEIVYAFHFVEGLYPIDDIFKVDIDRCAFHQHMERVFRHPPAADQNEHGDDDTGERVGDAPIEENHQQCSNDRTDRTEQVPQHVKECGSHIQVVFGAAAFHQHPCDDDIDDET